jgi:heme/copper-type cytochrome/quinol oxidase subunit 2
VPVIRFNSASRMTRRIAPFLLAVAATLIVPALAGAADLSGGWGDWWLPPDRSKHGHSIDSLFVVTFWITMVTFVAVELCLVVFLIKYRHRPDKKKATFTHGNTRLEMAWTIAPAIILALLAVANKGAWDAIRFNPDADNPNRALILVIGEQFKWNVIYPGPDGKLGRYLIFPKPTDKRWPGGITFPPGSKIKGPAEMKYDDAVKAINAYIAQENPLGKDFDDPTGKDDDFEKSPGRAIYIPADRPVEVQLSSKDVIHDFFLPNFRVKLDAVPGMRGKLVFTATMTSKQRELVSRRVIKIDDLAAILNRPKPPDLYISISKDSPGAVKDPKKDEYLYVEDPKAAKPRTIIRNDQPLTADRVVKLKTAGVTEVGAYEPGSWDLVCEELCGANHYTMRGQIFVLDSDEYNKRFEGGRSLNKPTTQPTNIAMK